MDLYRNTASRSAALPRNFVQSLPPFALPVIESPCVKFAILKNPVLGDAACACLLPAGRFPRFALERSLPGRGHQVIAMDNLITGRTANIEHLAGREGFLFVKHDVTDYIYVEGPLDAVLHFASPASPIDYLELPSKRSRSALSHAQGPGARQGQGARFLLASTSEVYGDPLIHPQTEDYWGNVNPVGPRGFTTRPSALPRR